MRFMLAFEAGRRRDAFTLVEVMIVVVIIGILAGVAVPYFTTSSAQARLNSLAATTRIMQSKIAERQASTGSIPPTIDPTWFGITQLAAHPENTIGVATLEVVNTANLFHPANKVLAAGVAGAYWYNSAVGVVRARVAARATSTTTAQAYNFVNASSESEANLGNFASGGGTGGSGS